MTRGEAFSRLKALGAAQALVGFSGGHDDGGVDQIKLVGADGQPLAVQLDVHGEWKDGKWTKSKDSELVDALAAPVYDEYGSFAGEFSVSGTVTWDVEQRTVHMSKSESVSTWVDREYDV